MENIILASLSERRSRILSECGIKHEVVPSHIDEITGAGENIEKIVIKNAESKAMDVASDNTDSIVIGADTLVVHDNKVIGKPKSEEEAKCMLKNFSGSKLDVYTGLCVAKRGQMSSGVDKSSLQVVKIGDEKIDKYFNLLGPYDKAGGFSIEGVGSLLFDNIEGSYFNILGLPMIKLKELFENIELDISDYIQPDLQT